MPQRVHAREDQENVVQVSSLRDVWSLCGLRILRNLEHKLYREDQISNALGALGALTTLAALTLELVDCFAAHFRRIEVDECAMWPHNSSRDALKIRFQEKHAAQTGPSCSAWP